jgi:hypothetical protein
MLFNSYEFIFLFLPVTFAVYFVLNRRKLLLAAKAGVLLSRPLRVLREVMEIVRDMEQACPDAWFINPNSSPVIQFASAFGFTFSFLLFFLSFYLSPSLL